MEWINEWFFYGLAFLVAVAITSSAVYALYWSSTKGQLRDLEKGAASIFDDKEPVGEPTDFFPAKLLNVPANPAFNHR